MRCFEKFKNYSIDWKKSFRDNPDTHIACGVVLSRLGCPEEAWSQHRRLWK